MSSLVEELQRACIENEVDISNLLRKAVFGKLKIQRTATKNTEVFF